MPDDIQTIPAPDTVERFINHVLVSKKMALLIDDGETATYGSAPSFSPTILAQFDTYQENHSDISFAMIDCAPEDGKKKLTEKQFLTRFYRSVTKCYPDYSADELVSELESALERYGDVIPVFLNPQLLCTKKPGRSNAYASIGSIVTSIRHVWDHSKAPMIFCCTEGFLGAMDADEAGMSFKWRCGMWMRTSELR